MSFDDEVVAKLVAQRDELAEALRDVLHQVKWFGVPDGFDEEEAQKALKELDSDLSDRLKNSGWVYCSERLPEETEDYEGNDVWAYDASFGVTVEDLQDVRDLPERFICWKPIGVHRPKAPIIEEENQ